MPALLTIEHLTKVFPGQVALDDVDLEIEAGTTHALVGQNGSGKSTLIKILAGYHQPTGDLATATYYGNDPTGEQLETRQWAALRSDPGSGSSIRTSVSSTPSRRWRTWRSATGSRPDGPRSTGGAIGSERRMRSTRSASRVSTCDGPSERSRRPEDWRRSCTGAHGVGPRCPSARARRTHGVAAGLRCRAPVRGDPACQGRRRVAILYVSHHLDEVFEIADHVSILRDGRRIATKRVADLDHDRLIELMIGHKIVHEVRPDHRLGGAVLLRVAGLSGGNVDGVDVTVNAGDVVGIAGITGSGREDLVPLLSGQIPSTDGNVWVNGRAVANYDPRDVLQSGGAFVPADRKGLGVFPLLSVIQNTTICDVARNARHGHLDGRAERVDATTWIDRLSVKTSSGDAPIATLSGGNQQKVLFRVAFGWSPPSSCSTNQPRASTSAPRRRFTASSTKPRRAARPCSSRRPTPTSWSRVATRVVVMRAGKIVAQLTGDQINSASIERAQLAGPVAHSDPITHPVRE